MKIRYVNAFFHTVESRNWQFCGIIQTRHSKIVYSGFIPLYKIVHVYTLRVRVLNTIKASKRIRIF